MLPLLRHIQRVKLVLLIYLAMELLKYGQELTGRTSVTSLVLLAPLEQRVQLVLLQTLLVQLDHKV